MTKTPFSPRLGFLIFIGLAILSYSLFQARFLILGPMIEISSPFSGQSVEVGMYSVEGVAKNVAWISLNDRQIFTDENGLWSEKLIAQPGPSIISVKARDRFGRETEERLEIFTP